MSLKPRLSYERSGGGGREYACTATRADQDTLLSTMQLIFQPVTSSPSPSTTNMSASSFLTYLFDVARVQVTEDSPPEGACPVRLSPPPPLPPHTHHIQPHPNSVKHITLQSHTLLIHSSVRRARDQLLSTPIEAHQ